MRSPLRHSFFLPSSFFHFASISPSPCYLHITLHSFLPPTIQPVASLIALQYREQRHHPQHHPPRPGPAWPHRYGREWDDAGEVFDSLCACPGLSFLGSFKTLSSSLPISSSLNLDSSAASTSTRSSTPCPGRIRTIQRWGCLRSMRL